MRKQFVIFILVGGLQYILDATVFSLLILALSAEVSNVLSRLAGALLGFFLNGTFTFKKDGKANVDWVDFLRFGLVWSLMTVVSTLLIGLIMSVVESHDWVYLVCAKLFVEAAIVILSFTLQKLFVFR